MKKSLYTIFSLFLVLAFSGLMLFIMLACLDILDFDNGIRAMVFAVIDLFALLVFVGFGRSISKGIGVGMYVPVCIATVAYIIVSFVLTFITFAIFSELAFTIIKLVLMFIFLCVIIPLIVAGINSKRNEDTRQEIKKHNI